MKRFIITVLGQDRPGIIAAVSGTLFDHTCNIEAVSQTILQTQFSGTFIISTPEGLAQEALRGHLKKGLDPLSLDVFLKPIDTEAIMPDAVESEAFVITTRGPDQKGLVARITAIIAGYGVNVTNLQAVFKGGDDPDDNIMIYEVDVPTRIDQQSLHRDLRQKADELHLEISIQHRNIFEAINRI